jgi:hypothetical protein
MSSFWVRGPICLSLVKCSHLDALATALLGAVLAIAAALIPKAATRGVSDLGVSGLGRIVWKQLFLRRIEEASP